MKEHFFHGEVIEKDKIEQFLPLTHYYVANSCLYFTLLFHIKAVYRRSYVQLLEEGLNA